MSLSVQAEWTASRLADRLLIDSKSLRIIAVLMAGVMALAPSLAAAQSAPPNVPAGTINIVPDGRTATQVQTSGATTNITTSTISGPNAFNSFSHFQQGSGTTVNLQVPTGASNLVNLVRDSPVVINGILNSYKDGKIGGNVYFADPYGFVVGKSGVVNVGSLNVSTPTREFMDGVISPSGQINSAAANRLMSGDTPVSPNGYISIRGRINAQDGVRLSGQSVAIGVRSASEVAHMNHAAKFAATVNSKGMRSASGIVVRNGSIQIVAAGDARINGRLSANGRRGRDAGNINVAAGRNITVTKNAKLSAKATGPTGNAGEIVVKADKNLTVQSGAAFDVSSKNGNAGFVELSAKQVAAIANASYNFSAPNGKAGSLLIDPYDLVITGDPANSSSGAANDYTVSNSIFSHGANVTLTADNSITIAATGVIDTREVGLRAGDITLKAPKITILGQLLADTATGATAPGIITLEATAREKLNSGKATAEAEITINGVVSGGFVSAKADATAISSYTLTTDLWVTKAALEAANPIGLDAGWVAADSKAKVIVGPQARITANTVDLISNSLQSAEDPAVNITLGSPVGATVVVGQIWGTSIVQVQKDAELNVGGQLTLKATNNSTLKPQTLTLAGLIGSTQMAVVASIAYGSANITTSATIDAGAKILNAGSISVQAHNDNDFNVKAVAYGFGATKAGLTVAVSEINTSAVARIAADLGTANAPIGDIFVNASTDTQSNQASASTTVGNSTLAFVLAGTALLSNFYKLAPVNVTAASTFAYTYSGQASQGPTSTPKVSGSTAFLDSTVSTSASIEADPGFNAPAIYSYGAVTVKSDMYATGLKTFAISGVNSEGKDPSASNPQATVGLSVAVAIGNYNHNSSAYIGPGVTVNAASIEVNARTNVPLTLPFTDWSSAGVIFEDLLTFIETNILVGNGSNSSAQSRDFAFSGSADFITYNTNTVAWVGKGASLTANSGPVVIKAYSHVESLNMAGLLGLSGGVGGQGPDSTAVGGSFNVASTNTRTIAGIGDGVSVTVAAGAGNGVTVTARTEDITINASPTNGMGTGIAGTGLYSSVAIDNVTHASISNLATITAPSVDISATQQLQVYSFTGSFTGSSETGVGLSLAISQIVADTAAYIGDNHLDISVDLDPNATGIGTRGKVSTDSLTMLATTYGVDVVGGIATQHISDNPDARPAGTPPKALKLLGGVPTDSKTQLGVAGAVAVLEHDLKTRAFLNNVEVDRFGATGASAVAVNAVNNVLMVSVAGAAALNSATTAGNKKTFSAAIAGAIAVAISENDTEAYIQSSTLSHMKSVDVNAMAGGLEAIVGIAAGLNSNADAQKSASVAGSVSVGEVTDKVYAYIADSGISNAGASGALLGGITVSAYQSTNIGMGGGALYDGGTGGFGLAITYAVVGDPSGGDATRAAITNTRLDNFTSVTVSASDPARIYVGAAMVGLSTPNGLGGTFVISDIGRSTSAEFMSGANAGTLTVRDSVSVSANDTRNSTLESFLGGAGSDPNAPPRGTNDAPPIDFSATAATNLTDPGSSVLGNGAAILSIAGVVQYDSSGKPGTAAIGVGVVDAYIHQRHIAVIDHAIIDAATANVAVTAQDSAAILSIGIGIGIQSNTKYSLQAAISENRIDNEVLARIGGDTATPQNTSINAKNVFVDAEAGSVIRSFALTLAFGQQAAGGITVAYNSVDGSVGAVIDGAKVSAAQDVRVTGQSDANILTVSVGIADGNKFALAGSTSNNLMGTDVAAKIMGGSDVLAGGNVLVNASNSDKLAVIAGALGSGGSAAGIGISIVTNDISGETAATIGENSVVDAKGASAGVSVGSGKLANGFDVSTADAPTATPPNLTETQIVVQGLAVVATSHQSVVANAVTIGLATGGSGVGLAIVPVINTMGGSTVASIDGSQIDTRLVNGAARSDLQVIASSHSYTGNFVVGGSAASAAGAAAIARTDMTRATTASISDSLVGTAPIGAAAPQLRSVGIAAEASQISSAISIGFAAGKNGAGAASGIINIFDADTTAYFDQGSLNAGSLVVSAHSTNAYFAGAGAGAIGGGLGIAAAFMIGTSSNTTLAYVGDATNSTSLTLDGRLAISAIGENEFNTYAVGAAGAGNTGIAGMVAVTIVGNDTRAGLYNTSVVQRATSTQTDVDANNNPVVNPAGIQITAVENIDVKPITGALGIGISGVGIGAAANIVLMTSKLTSEVVGGQINSPGTLLVSSSGQKTIDAITITVGGGFSAGIGAAVAVILLGAGVPTDVMADLDAGGAGSLSTVNAMGTDNNFILSVAGLTTFRAAAGANATDEQVQAYAQQQYLGLLNNGAVQSGAYTLNAAALNTYRAAAAAKLGVATATDQQVRDYTAALYVDLIGGRTRYALNDTALPGYAQTLLNSTDYTAFQQLTANGVAKAGSFALNSAGLAVYRPIVAAAIGNPIPTDQQIQDYAAAQYLALYHKVEIAADTQYASLIAAGAVNGGKFALAAANVSNYVQQALTSTDYTSYQQLLANGTVANGVYTLGNGALANYRAAAGQALVTDNPTDQQVRDYAAGRYDTFVQTTKNYAAGQYQQYAVSQENAAKPYSVNAALGGARDAVIASVDSSNVTASAVQILSRAAVSTDSLATGVGLSVVAGVGAAVTYTSISDTVLASLTASSIHSPSVTVQANMADGQGGVAGKATAAAGAGALGAAVGAAVSDVRMTNSVTAAVGGTLNGIGAGAAPTLNVSANDSSSMRSDAYGAAVGGGAALGVSVALVSKGSTVSAGILDGANITASAINVTATNAGSVYAYALAGAGGLLFAGTGAAADASDVANVTARIGAATLTVGSGDISVNATDTPDAKAASIGVTIAGVGAVGVSVAHASVGSTVLAEIDGAADVFTAGNLNVNATSTYAGVGGGATNSFPSNGQLRSTADFNIGETSAASWAIAGAGAIYLSATGVSALSENHASVAAKLDDGFILPNGNVVLVASNVSNQVSRGIGITVGGLLAIGVVQVRSTSDTTTQALVGEDVSSSVLRTGNLNVTASAFDNNSAKAQAGSGGLLAGSGAEATTSGTSNTTASIGMGSAIAGGDIVIGASHSIGFFASVDSLSAAALGASASVASNIFTSNVTASIGDNVTLLPVNSLTATATNAFTRTGSDESANAAAGGGINGAGASSTTTLTGNTLVSFGANALVSAGTGGITALASSTLNFYDSVTLNTGGFIQGAGVESKLFATFDNDVTVADSQANAIGQFITQGAINFGTFAQANAVNNSTVSTYGLASVGFAVSETNLTVRQSVDIGTNNTLLAVGNVSLTPGLDPVQFRSTSLTAFAGAYGYIYGIIAIPGAFASSSVVSEASVEIRSGAKVLSAGNVEIGAYHGTPNASAEGRGKGYALYFIPIEVSDSSVSKTTKGDVTIDGAVTAGLYREQEILINCGVLTCGRNTPAQLQLLKGAPVVVNGVLLQALSSPSQVVASQQFDAAGYVNANFDPDVAPVMLLGVSSTPVQGFMIGPMFAAGGNVTISADVLKGSGVVTALGAPTIKLTNNSAAYVVLSQAYIPDTPGGRILFTGTAQQASAPASLNFVGDNRTDGYDISIGMNYAGQSVGNSGSGPAFINSGNIVNLGGSVNMTSATGWFGQLGDVMARSVSEYAPNGGLVVSAVNPGQMFSAGSFPYSDWVNFMTFPGSATGSAPALLNTTEQAAAAMSVVSYIANLYAKGLDPRITDPSLLDSTWHPSDAQSLLSLKLIGQAGNVVLYLRGFYNLGGVPLTDDTTNNNNVSHVFFGSCGWSAGGRCGDANFAGALSPAGFAYMLNGNSTGDEIWQPVVPYVISRGTNGSFLNFSTAANNYLLTANSYNFANIANSAPKTFGTPGLIKAFGGPVAIKANIININGTIETGRPNSWSVNLPQTLMTTVTTSQVLDHYDVNVTYSGFFPNISITPVYRTDVTGGGEIAQYQAKYDLGQASLLSGSHINRAYETLGPLLTLQTTTTSATGDKKVDVTYDARTRTISVNDVNASSGGGFVLLDGKIINTGPTANAMINVNGGLGQVAINNQTALQVALNAINNGSTVDGKPVVSTVRIVDRLQADTSVNTTTYYYTPGVGMTVYKTSNGATPIAGVTPIFAQTGSASAQYIPVEGARFQWQQQTQVQRDIIWALNSDGTNSGLIDDITPWRFTSLQAGGNPWYFVAANGSLVGNDQAQGNVIIDVGSKNTVFKQTMSAEITNRYMLFHGYGGCSGVGSFCNYGFKEATDYQFPNPGFATWFYDYILGAKLTLTSSVKADNPFSINFFGNATASLNVASNAAVTLNGNITNPSGKSTFNITGGGLTQAPTSVFQTGDLVVNAAGGIGSVAQPLTAVVSAGAVVRTQSGTAVPVGGVLAANNTYLKFNSGVSIDRVAAGTSQTGYSDVSITAAGDVLRASRHADGSTMGANDINLSGSNLTITSTTGGVGSSAAPLVMSANYRTNSNGSLDGGVVTVSAVGEVALTQIAGLGAADPVDLRVGSIVTAGDVYLKIVNGTLLDASGKTGSSTLSDAQVAANSQRLHLTLADGAAQNAIDTGITSFENLYNRSYASYFSLKANGAVSGSAQVAAADLAATVSMYRPLAEAAQVEAARQQGQNFAGTALTTLTDAQVLAFAATLNTKNGVFVVDAAKLALYRPLAAAALKIVAPTDAQVQAYANAQYQTYATVFERGSGANWSSQAQFTAQQSSFAFLVDPSSGLAQALTSGSVWDPKQLIAAIDRTPITVGNTAATVAGQRVNIEATGGGIGQTAAPVTITLTDLRAGTLTAEQKKALAGAAPGSVFAVAADGSEYATDNLPGGVQITSIKINQTSPVFVSASSTVNGTADTDIYIQATGTPFTAGQILRIGSMSALGNINLVAGSGIVASTEPTAAAARIVAGGDLSLLTDSNGTSSIGSEPTPLTYSAGGRLVAAVAGKDIYLKAVSDTTLGRVQAGDTLYIETTAGGMFSYLTNAAVSGKNVILIAAGDIGTSSQPLLVQVGALGELNGTATGAAYLYGPTLATDAGARPLHIGAFTANGALIVTSDADLTARTLTSVTGLVTVGAGANAVLGTVTGHSQSVMRLTAIDNLTVDQASNPGGVELIAGKAITIGAGGAVQAAAGAISAEGQSLTMGAGSTFAAAKDITIETVGDAVLGQLSTPFNPLQAGGTAVSVAASAGAILSNGDGRTNIIANAPNAGISLAAQAGIGGPIASNGPAIIIDTPFANATTATGDIRIVSLSSIHVPTLSAVKGSVQLVGGGNIIADQVFAGTAAGAVSGGVTLTAPNGFLTIGESRSGGTQNLLARDDIRFSKIVTAGLVNDPGDVLLTSIRGTIRGGTITAAGSIGILSDSSDLEFDQPGGLVLIGLRGKNMNLRTNSDDVTLTDAFISGVLTITTPNQTILMNNGNPTPKDGPNTQLYKPGQVFDLQVSNNNVTTDAYVIDFQNGTNIFYWLTGGYYTGVSLVRNVISEMQAGLGDQDSNSGLVLKWTQGVPGVSPGVIIEGLQLPKSIETVGDGPAVNVEGIAGGN